MDNKQFFEDLQKRLDKSTEGIKNSVLRRTAAALAQDLESEKNVRVATQKNSITVKEEDDGRLGGDGPVDMKPFFRRSAKVNRREKGGWYLRVPIRLYTPSKDPEKQSHANRMTNRLYKDLVKQEPGEVNRQLVSDYLYDKRQVSPIPELNYTPKTKNVTRLPNPKGRGGIYVAFRTVSDRSPANSWIINRKNARPDNLSNRIKRIIRQVRRDSGGR